MWIDADYDGPLPDGAVLKHSSKPYNKSSGHYTLKLIHGSINESASRFKVYTAKGLGADEAKARAMARLKKGESKDFNFLVGYIERNAVSEGTTTDRAKSWRTCSTRPTRRHRQLF